MKKIISVIFALMGFAILFSACGGETYADKLKKETKAINRFIDANGIKVLNEYPSNNVFAENEYYKDANTGVYIRVINPGNDDKPSREKKTDVYLRYENILNMLNENDTLATSNQQGVYMTFKYGMSSTYTGASSSSLYGSQMYYFLSQACVIPLDHGLGNNAEVSLIVPFASGSTYQQTAYVPLYYQTLKYRFTNDEPEEN
ncbi:DUF4827 family protein [Dysgonomonas sp. Marseille-P4677]|uniref:DUF4827 family protein n=1 Tax=Dysgonomonas sp. Marseille-P4677 TaxID=2364790 RepID=UPI0019130C31|nr:DUF4827 family protein [Dysgonomonas sp. Marseille-P4677]MBK5722021.1 DUF4827 family protein [Dysgonomonas sp. Marseille-P4677]